MSLLSCIFQNALTIFCLVLILITAQFVWQYDDPTYDCIVGISIDNKPYGVGVIVSTRFIVTSANSIERLWKWTSKYAYTLKSGGVNIKIHFIDGAYDKSRIIETDTIAGNQLYRNGDSYRVKIGFDSIHSTVFDFMYISFKKNTHVQKKYIPGNPRHPFVPESFITQFRNNSPKSIIDRFGWKFAAFGFKDKDHINDSTSLESASFEMEAVEEDCDEWLPRRWGSFICIANVNNFVGVQSGAALFNGKVLVGIGSFELRKGSESILVFTKMSVTIPGVGYYTAPY